MKNFMETNTITHNLMSFSGFKSLLIFSMLTQSPKSYEEIREEIEKNEYLKEKVSIDTIRIYINSLRSAGCKIDCVKQGRTNKYFINSNPFELKITDNQVKSIIKVYEAIAKSIDISDFMALQNFFNKIAKYITNEDLKNKLINLSPFNNINSDIINDLVNYIGKNITIKVLYYSKISGEKNINIIPDKLSIVNGKLYLSGYNLEYKNYSEFLVSDIKKIISIDLKPITMPDNLLVVRYEYYKEDHIKFEPLENEKIIEENEDKIIIDISSQNKFMITQRILSFANKCCVISPQNYKDEIINCLKRMKENYIEK